MNNELRYDVGYFRPVIDGPVSVDLTGFCKMNEVTIDQLWNTFGNVYDEFPFVADNLLYFSLSINFRK